MFWLVTSNLSLATRLENWKVGVEPWVVQTILIYIWEIKPLPCYWFHVSQDLRKCYLERIYPNEKILRRFIHDDAACLQGVTGSENNHSDLETQSRASRGGNFWSTRTQIQWEQVLYNCLCGLEHVNNVTNCHINIAPASMIHQLHPVVNMRILCDSESQRSYLSERTRAKLNLLPKRKGKLRVEKVRLSRF